MLFPQFLGLTRLVPTDSGWQSHDELRPATICRVFNPKSAAMSLDNAVCKRQSHARAGRFAIADVSITHGAKKLFEYPFPHVCTNARALIFNTHQDGTV